MVYIFQTVFMCYLCYDDSLKKKQPCTFYDVENCINRIRTIITTILTSNWCSAAISVFVHFNLIFFSEFNLRQYNLQQLNACMQFYKFYEPWKSQILIVDSFKQHTKNCTVAVLCILWYNSFCFLCYDIFPE